MTRVAQAVNRQRVARWGLNLYTLNCVLAIGGLAVYGILRATGLWGLARGAAGLALAGLVALWGKAFLAIWRRGGRLARFLLVIGHMSLLTGCVVALLPVIRESIAVSRLSEVGFEFRFAHETRDDRDRTVLQHLLGDRILRALGQRCRVYHWSRGSHEWGGAEFNARLRHLRDIRQMDSLHVIQGASLDDAGAQHLGQIAGLNWLIVPDSQITDRGLASLVQIPGLTSLDVSGSQISDSGLAAIRTLASLENLSLANTAVSNEGLRHLTGLRIRSLNVSRTSITDPGLSTIAKIGTLRSLSLRATQVSAAGVAALTAMPVLEMLDLRETPFAAEAAPFTARSGLTIATQ